MHGLAYGVVAAERKRQIRDAPGDMCVRQFGADALGRLDKGHCIAIMLFNPRGNREDVGIEDDVFGRKP